MYMKGNSETSVFPSLYITNVVVRNFKNRIPHFSSITCKFISCCKSLLVLLSKGNRNTSTVPFYLAAR